MRGIDIIIFSASNFLRRKTRSVLTVLGVVIGTAAVVIMISIGVGMNKGFEDQISGWSNLRQIDVYKNWGYNEKGEETDVIGVMDKQSLEDIKSMGHVHACTPQLYYYATLVMGKKQANIQFYGIDPSQMQKLGYKIGSGRLLNADDIGQGSFVMNYKVPFLISNPKKPVYWYEEFFGEPHPFDPLNEAFKITMDGSYGTGMKDLSKQKPKLYNMDCVGVLEQKPEGMEWDAVIYMDIDLLLKYKSEFEKQNSGGGSDGGIEYEEYSSYRSSSVAIGGKPVQDSGNSSNGERADVYDSFIVLVDKTENVQAVEKKIREMGFSTNSAMSYLIEQQKQTEFLRTILGAIGVIAFLVAALSIINTMIMSIYERTREIGVMKVLGCRLSDIRSMFLTEAGIIGIVGGVGGVGASYGVSSLLNYLARGKGGLLGYTGDSALSVVPLWLSFVALILAVAVGIASGLYPAIRATRLPALEAIKNE